MKDSTRDEPGDIRTVMAPTPPPSIEPPPAEPDIRQGTRRDPKTGQLVHIETENQKESTT